ncbi:iron complex transport system permease protein [Clostridium amylolyticum]|uniref:Iron complex transport system permease protein n=1 Tax=Clostridium amylolyticum TaxID=1121298 RepID=A0A1M6HEJ9_9CLOT|nr:ABC transporter permease [Clostridium amylolyticum]SHJ20586.1 iron complex transport system permease protein [Clostridium amylolyticum]
MKKKHLIILLIILSILSLFIGAKDIKPMDILRLKEEHIQVLLISRIPRLISIIVVGMSMSISGLIMQAISRNKFVSPTTAATTDWARFGILISMMLFSSASYLQKMLIAFLFALGGTFLFMKLLNKIKYKNSIFIPLLGIMLGNIVSSITTFFAYKHDLIQNISSWLQGDFSLIIKGRYELLYIGIPLLITAYIYGNKFTIAGMGEEFSINLGLNYNKVVTLGLVIVALITSVTVLTVGTIPFLGLIVPNIVSLYNGDNLKDNIPHTALLGGVFVLACDILGRVLIYPYELSIGVVVGVLGSGIFLYLLMRRKNYAV